MFCGKNSVDQLLVIEMKLSLFLTFNIVFWKPLLTCVNNHIFQCQKNQIKGISTDFHSYVLLKIFRCFLFYFIFVKFKQKPSLQKSQAMSSYFSIKLDFNMSLLIYFWWSVCLFFSIFSIVPVKLVNSVILLHVLVYLSL